MPQSPQYFPGRSTSSRQWLAPRCIARFFTVGWRVGWLQDERYNSSALEERVQQQQAQLRQLLDENERLNSAAAAEGAAAPAAAGGEDLQQELQQARAQVSG
jgi:hypothetical protein